MVEIKRRTLELFDGKISTFFPQIQATNGDWVSITNAEGKQLAFNEIAPAQKFLSEMPKQAYQIHEYIEPVSNLKIAGEA